MQRVEINKYFNNKVIALGMELDWSSADKTLEIMIWKYSILIYLN